MACEGPVCGGDGGTEGAALALAAIEEEAEEEAEREACVADRVSAAPEGAVMGDVWRVEWCREDLPAIFFFGVL